jgi:hypothetical protein
MQKYVVSAILLVAFVSLVALVARVWLAKRNEQESMFVEPNAPLSDVVNKVQGFYVATTLAGQPLDRVSAYGLAHRGRAAFAMGSSGISIERQGERSFSIPKASILNLDMVQGTIDRVVDSEGLIAITWQLGSTNVETAIRIVDRGQRVSFYSELKGLVSKENAND